MITEQLLNFIKDQQSKSISREAITNMLLGQGWSQVDIDQAWNTVNSPIVNQAPIQSTQSIPTYTAPQPQVSYTPPAQNYQQSNMMAQGMPIQKKSNTGLIIGIVIFLLLLVGGAYAYLTYFNTPKLTPIPLDTTESTTTDMVATKTDEIIPVIATTTATTTPVVKAPVKITPPVVVKKTTPIVQVPVVPDAPKPVVIKPVPVPGTWQNDPKKRLCWDGFQVGCEPIDGYYNQYNTIDINGDGSVLLGAVEYCQYLDPNGVTIDKQPQNFWRLPTLQEMTNKYASDSSGFHYLSDHGYWAITATKAANYSDADYMTILSDGTFLEDSMNKVNALYVRCIQ